MKNISSTAKEIIRNIVILGVAEAAAGFFILLGGIYGPGHVAGVIFGSFIAVIKILQLESSINKTLDRSGKNANRYYNIQYFVRLFITVAAFAVAVVFHPNINILSTGIGLLNMSVAAHMYKFFHKNDDSVNV